jgi:hypothetical protein
VTKMSAEMRATPRQHNDAPGLGPIPNESAATEFDVIPMSVQDETNSLVFRAAGFVARSLQIAADMRLAHASPAARNPARLSLILNAHWNKQGKFSDHRSRKGETMKPGLRAARLWGDPNKS